MQPATPTTPPARRPARTRASAAVAWALGAPLALLLVGGTIVHVATSGDISTTGVVFPLAAIPYLIVGGVIVTRLPRHPVGWLLWAGGVAIATTAIAQVLAGLGPASAPGTAPGAVWFAWLNAWAGPLALFLVPVFLPLLYPTGRPPSRAWWPVVILGILFVAAWCIGAAFRPFAPGNYPPGVANPFALGGSAASVVDALPSFLSPVGLLLLVLDVGSLIVRYRRARGIERAQLKWFVFVGATGITALVVAAGAGGSTEGVLATIDGVAWLVGIGAIAFMPLAVGVAVLRYRLYEIDRLISRTIAYGLVTLALLTVFVSAILVLQALMAPFTRSNELAVAGSTLLIAALFQPLRSRIKRLVDRRFNRSHYDAERTLAAFTGRLRDEVELDTVRMDILATVEATLEPTAVSLWLRE